MIGAAHLTLNIDPMLALLRYDPDMDLAQEDWAAFMQPRETPPPCEKSQELSSGVEKDCMSLSFARSRDVSHADPPLKSRSVRPDSAETRPGPIKPKGWEISPFRNLTWKITCSSDTVPSITATDSAKITNWASSM